MILAREVDPLRAQIYLRFLAGATDKIEQTDTLKQELRTKIAEVETQTENTLSERLKAVETRLKTTLAKEKALREQYKADLLAERDVETRINELIAQLDRCIENHDTTKARVKELDQKVEAHTKPILEKKEELKLMLKRLEEIKKTIPKSTEGIARVNARIRLIKQQLSN